MAKSFAVTEKDLRGLAVRLSMLETHYRKPKDFQVADLNRAAKTLRRWLAACVLSDDPPPESVVLAILDDLNTPAAIAEMHRLAKTDGRALFAGMRLLGLIPGEGKRIDYCFGEVKTIPIDHIPVVHFHGFGTANMKAI